MRVFNAVKMENRWKGPQLSSRHVPFSSPISCETHPLRFPCPQHMCPPQGHGESFMWRIQSTEPGSVTTPFFM